MKKPIYLIEIKMEKIQGFPYEQPVNYCGGIELDSDRIKDFKNIFGISLATAIKESSCYNNSKKIIMYDSILWENNKAKEKAFNKVYDFHKKGKSGNGSSVTPLFPFEIRLLNNGFEIDQFAELNAYYPRRCYKKNDKIVDIVFGIRPLFSVIVNSNVEYELDNTQQGYNNIMCN